MPAVPDRFFASQCICNLIKSVWWLRKFHASIFQIGFYVIKNKFKSNRDFGVLLRIPMSGVGKERPCVGVGVLSKYCMSIQGLVWKVLSWKKSKGYCFGTQPAIPSSALQEKTGGGKHEENPWFKNEGNRVKGLVIPGYLVTGIICFCRTLLRKRRRACSHSTNNAPLWIMLTPSPGLLTPATISW